MSSYMTIKCFTNNNATLGKRRVFPAEISSLLERLTLPRCTLDTRDFPCQLASTLTRKTPEIFLVSTLTRKKPRCLSVQLSGTGLLIADCQIKIADLD